MKVFWAASVCITILGLPIEALAGHFEEWAVEKGHYEEWTAAQAAVNTTGLPKCGLLCFAEMVPASPCSLTNVTCMCTTPALTLAIDTCVVENCTVIDQLATQKYSYTMCGVVAEDRSLMSALISGVGAGIALVAYLLRIVAKLLHTTGPFGMDDVCLLLVICFTIPFAVLGVDLTQHGLGKDMWSVAPDDITHVLYLFFWDELIYLTLLPLLKLTFLFFYLRTFKEKTFQILCYIMVSCNVAYAIAFVLISIFQCKPISGAWTRWDGTFEGHCNNINLQGWMSASINIALDILTLSLPLFPLWKLALPLKKKYQIFIMFSLGFVVTFISILRLGSMIQFASTTNVTQDYVAIGYWSNFEIYLGIICICMPAIRQLFRRVAPGFTRAVGLGGDSKGAATPLGGTKLTDRSSQGYRNMDGTTSTRNTISMAGGNGNLKGDGESGYALCDVAGKEGHIDRIEEVDEHEGIEHSPGSAL